VSTTATVRLHNGDDVARHVTMSSSADLADHLRLDPTSRRLEPYEIADVTVTIEVPSSVESGTYLIAVEVDIGADDTSTAAGRSSRTPTGPGDQPGQPDGAPATGTTAVIAPQLVVATATVDVAAHNDFAITLQPTRSRGSGAVSHVVRLVNTGNLLVAVDLSAAHDRDDIDIELADTSLTAAPGVSTETTLRVNPTTRHWSGATTDHPFKVHISSQDGRADDLSGVYQQRPRVPNWLGPAAAGAFAALVIGAIVWFAFLRPWVDDTAEQAATDAIEDDRAALRDRIAELEAAAAEAEELPLGVPIDFRLEAAPTSGTSGGASADVEPGTVVSITDVVFQNPTGAVGTVALRRGTETLLQSELANFRDFDLHFVAPFVFDEDATIELDVECRTPGAGLSDCPIAASLVGFVDQAN
jgi:hypothetical protein